jgi:subtilisin family serine protease
LNNRKIKLIKLNKILGLLLLVVGFVFASSGKDTDKEKQDYINAGGEIVTIFEHEVTDQELKDLTKDFNNSLEVIKHIDDYALISVKNSIDYYDVLDNLKTYPGVAEAQGNIYVETLGFSNDTYADAQWAIYNPGAYLYLSELGSTNLRSTADIDMDVVEAWDYLHKTKAAKREVVVAVIDTGVDYQHPELANRMWVNTGEIKDNGIDDDGNGYVDDYYGWDFYNNDSSVCHYKYSTKYNKYMANPEIMMTMELMLQVL